ncbi:hypothetical protein BHE74_00044522 [Ensete ventricosum]|nr:hypothetical protein BHE74_00044522 [Ensete ventricosum]
MQGWLALARPSQGWPATCKGAAGSTRGHSHLQRDARKVGRLQGARKERPLVASLQGATPTARATASRGSDVDRKSGCRWARAAVACAGVAVAAQTGQEGLGQSFYKKNELAPLNSRNSEDCPCV